MVIKCKNCHTMFNVNKNLLNKSGAEIRVKCSKCNHIFKATYKEHIEKVTTVQPLENTEILFNKDEIQHSVKRLAQKISSDYRGCNLVCIGVLKGAVIFMADLIREIDLPLEIGFVGVKSYGAGTTSSGKIQLTKPIDIDLKDKDILLVEDIVDTGLTINYLSDYLNSFGPKSLAICALIDKHERRKIEVEIDYVCIEIEKGFIVGYGLDFNGKYRNLPHICNLKL